MSNCLKVPVKTSLTLKLFLNSTTTGVIDEVSNVIFQVGRWFLPLFALRTDKYTSRVDGWGHEIDGDLDNLAAHHICQTWTSTCHPIPLYKMFNALKSLSSPITSINSSSLDPESTNILYFIYRKCVYNKSVTADWPGLASHPRYRHPQLTRGCCLLFHTNYQLGPCRWKQVTSHHLVHSTCT